MARTCIAVTTALLALAPVGALAQERAGDAAIGALSGAVVLGPVGAVAGAVVGFTAGPSIAHSWGLRRTAPPRASRPARRATQNSAPAGARQVASTPSGAAPSTSGQAPAGDTAAPGRRAAQASNRRNAMPPVQALE